MTPRIHVPRAFKPLLEPARYKGAHGGRGCCHPDTPIDTPSGQVKISEFVGGPVFSYEDGKIVVAQATASRPYTEEPLYLVRLNDGREISVTDQHRFLTQRGWVECRDLSTSDAVVVSRYQADQARRLTTQDSGPSVSREGAPRCSGTRADCSGDCSEYPHRYDQRLQSGADSGRVFVPSQDDGRRHSFHALTREDDQGYASRNILSLPLRRPSSPGALLGAAGRCFAAMGNSIVGRISEWLSGFSQFGPQFLRSNSLVLQGKGSLAPPLGFCSQKNQGKTPQTQRRKPSRASIDGSLFASSCNHDRPILVGVESICKHDRLVYWDLHVPLLENYLSNGIVNHNSGKSHFFAELLVARCLQEKTDAVCVREVQKSLAQSVKKLLELKIESMGVGAMFDIKQDFIGTPHGGRIIFQGMQNHTADTIKSLEGYDVAWVEEAQTLSQRSLDLLRPTIRKEGSELWFSWNPNTEDDPVDVLLRGESPPPGSIVIQANYRDNPWLPDVLKAEVDYDQRRDPDKFAHVWLGGYQRNSESRVFRNWRIDEFEAPPGATFRMGADWGFAVDPSVLIRCHLDGRTMYVDHEAYMVGCEIDMLPDLFDRVPESRKWFITADSARPETISYMRKHGYPKINAAIKGAKSVEEGVEFLKSFDIVVHPRCEHTIDELTMYSYEVDDLTGQVMPKLKDKDNHVIDALRYACEGVRKATKQRVVLPAAADGEYAMFG